MIEEQTLRELAERGIIAGPQESEEKFLERVSLLPSTQTPLSSPYYSMQVDWAPLSFEGKRLHFWEMGCVLIDESGRANVEISPRLNAGRSKWGYNLSEILHHEVVHLIRSQFNEPRFEEALAYATSSKSWRRYLGPLFSKPWEPLYFLATPFFPAFGWVLGLGFAIKLFWIHRALFLTKKRLAILFVYPKKVLLLLTDKEIKQFSRMNLEEIQQYSTRNQTLRWRQIRMLGSVRI